MRVRLCSAMSHETYDLPAAPNFQRCFLTLQISQIRSLVSELPSSPFPDTKWLMISNLTTRLVMFFFHLTSSFVIIDMKYIFPQLFTPKFLISRINLHSDQSRPHQWPPVVSHHRQLLQVWPQLRPSRISLLLSFRLLTASSARCQIQNFHERWVEILVMERWTDELV